jgi:cephalosporin hydroxylase
VPHSQLQTMLVRNKTGKVSINKQDFCLSSLSSAMDTVNGDLIVSIGEKGHKRFAYVDDIVHGYQVLFESAALYTYPNFLGVSLQQDPSDFFVLMDLLWRLKPDLVIELGTAGGGSAFFYAMIMTAYDKDAHVITMDPMRTKDWNLKHVKEVCPHCLSGRETPLWNSGVIHSITDRMPQDATSEVDSLIKRWGSKRVVVIEDSNHLTEVVANNLHAYAQYVTPGSYLIVQDMKMHRIYQDRKVSPRIAAQSFLEAHPLGPEFTVDRSFEYYYYTQHAQGFLQRKRRV